MSLVPLLGERCEHMSAIKLLEDFLGAISGDSLAPPARERCESMAVLGITAGAKCFAKYLHLFVIFHWSS